MANDKRKMLKALCRIFDCEFSDLENFEWAYGTSGYDSYYSFDYDGYKYIAGTEDACIEIVAEYIRANLHNGLFNFSKAEEEWIADNISKHQRDVMSDVLWEELYEYYYSRPLDELVAMDVLNADDVDENGEFIGDFDLGDFLYDYANEDYAVLLSNNDNDIVKAYLDYTGESIASLVDEDMITLDIEDLANYIVNDENSSDSAICKSALGVYQQTFYPWLEDEELYYLYKRV